MGPDTAFSNIQVGPSTGSPTTAWPSVKAPWVPRFNTDHYNISNTT